MYVEYALLYQSMKYSVL